MVFYLAEYTNLKICSADMVLTLDAFAWPPSEYATSVVGLRRLRSPTGAAMASGSELSPGSCLDHCQLVRKDPSWYHTRLVPLKTPQWCARMPSKVHGTVQLDEPKGASPYG